MKTGASLRNRAFDIKGIKDLPTWEMGLKTQVDDDKASMLPFLRKLAHFYARSYSMMGREVTQPWPGASDFILPLIDKYITKLKVGYHSVIHGPERPCAMQVLDERAIANRASAELYFNSILQGHNPRYSQPDFDQQTLYHIDNILRSGRGVLHATYSKRTDIGMMEIRRIDLPKIIAGLVFTPKMKDEERAKFQAAWEERGRTLNPDEVIAAFQDTVNPVTPSVFMKHANRFKEILVDDMGFDEDDPLDRAAIQELMRWLKEGLPDGKTAIHTRHVTQETPLLTDIPPEYVFVPKRTYDITQARRLTIEEEYTDWDFMRMAQDYEWPEDAVSNILDNGKQRHDQQVLGRELVDARRWRTEYGTLGNPEQEMIHLRTVYTWMDITGEGVPERVKYVYDPQTGERVSFQRYDGDSWPVAENRLETNEKSYFSSRPLGEIIDDMDRYVTGWHRHKHNNMAIQTTVGYFIERQSRWDPEANRFRPGGVIEVDNINDAREIQHPQTSIVIEREEQFLQTWVESYLGEVSHDLTADASLHNPRTATELMQRKSMREQVLSLRVRSFNSGMQRAYQLAWGLAQKHAPPTFGVQLSGMDPSVLRRDDIRGEFRVVPVGSVEDMDPEFRRQQAIRRFTFLTQYLQSDPNQIVFDVNTPMAGKMVMDELGLQESRLLMRQRSQEEIQQILEQRQQEAQMAAQYEEMAKRAMANAGNTPEEIEALIHEARSMMPHKGMQKIIDRGEAAKANLAETEDQARLAAAIGAE